MTQTSATTATPSPDSPASVTRVMLAELFPVWYANATDAEIDQFAFQSLTASPDCIQSAIRDMKLTAKSSYPVLSDFVRLLRTGAARQRAGLRPETDAERDERIARDRAADEERRRRRKAAVDGVLNRLTEEALEQLRLDVIQEFGLTGPMARPPANAAVRRLMVAALEDRGEVRR